MNLIGDIFTPAGTYIGDALNNLGRTIIKGGCSFYNKLVDLANEFFLQTPWEFAGGEGSDTWQLIMNCNTVFVGIAGSLLAVFWLIGYLSEITDIRQEMRLEQIIKIFVRLFVAEFMVCNSLNIVCGIFSLTTSVCSAISGTTTNIGIDYAADIRPSLERLNSSVNPEIKGASSLGNNIGLVFLAIIFAGIVVAIGVVIFMASIKRFLKVLVLIPYGSLAGAALAGNHTIKRTTESFYRYALAAGFEVITMILMLAIGSALMKGNLLQDLAGTVPGSSASGGTILIYILENLASKAVILGCIATGINQSEQITQRIIG